MRAFGLGRATPAATVGGLGETACAGGPGGRGRGTRGGRAGRAAGSGARGSGDARGSGGARLRAAALALLADERLEGIGHLGGGSEAILGVRGERLPGDVLERRWDAAVGRRRAGHGAGQAGRGDRRGRVARSTAAGR